MKIIILSAILFLSVSCRKNYTCSCTADDENYNISQTVNMTEVAAIDWCDELDQDNKINDEKIEGWKCVLKD